MTTVEMPAWVDRVQAATAHIDPATPRGSVEQYIATFAAMSEPGQGYSSSGGYSSTYQFVLDNGEWFMSQPLPKRYRPMPPKLCFHNAWTLAKRHPNELTYCEGYAAGIITVHHAWCVTTDGQVVDPTWDYRPDEARIGVRFSHDLMRAAYAVGRRTEAVAMLSDWRNDYPVLRTRPYDATATLALLRQIKAGK